MKMAAGLTLILLPVLCVCVTAQVSNSFLNFTMSPSKVALCGDHVASVVNVDCHLIPNVQGEVFIFEFGVLKGTGGRHQPIARITHKNHFNMSIVDLNIGRRLTQTNPGRLSLQLENPQKPDLVDYYCSATFIDGSLKYTEKTFSLTASDYSGKVPVCDEGAVRSAVQNHNAASHPSAGKCADGHEDRPEALVMRYCGSPNISDWQEGPRVMDNCCMIPPFTPVATFNFGMYLQDEHGFSGVFVGCINNGFSMAFQMCGHPPMILDLTRRSGASYVENPDNYHVMVHGGSKIQTILFGR